MKIPEVGEVVYESAKLGDEYVAVEHLVTKVTATQITVDNGDRYIIAGSIGCYSKYGNARRCVFVANPFPEKSSMTADEYAVAVSVARQAAKDAVLDAMRARIEAAGGVDSTGFYAVIGEVVAESGSYFKLEQVRALMNDDNAFIAALGYAAITAATKLADTRARLQNILD